MANYLYNGVELPERPDAYDRRPYKYIEQTTSGEYLLHVSIGKKTVSVKNDKHGYVINGLGDKSYSVDGGEWVISSSSGERYVVWSNTDVYYKTDDTLGELSGTLYLSASEPIATADGATYNGIELPKLPYITYPYEMIFQEGDGVYYFSRSASAMYYGSNGIYYCYLFDAPAQTFKLTDGEWVFSFEDPFWASDVVWSNHDIYSTVGDNAGTLMFAASEPVPVYPEPLYRDNATITLGSGTLYLTEYDGETLPDVESVCVEENRMGYTKGGAALQYTEETTEERDDLGYVAKIVTTKTDVVLKCGLITWNAYTLYKLIDRCTVEIQDGKRVVKIGGKGNENGKKYVVVFHHEDPIDGDLWAVIVGRNTAGFTITCTNEAGALIEPEFKALPHDTDGTLVRLIEGSLTH